MLSNLPPVKKQKGDNGHAVTLADAADASTPDDDEEEEVMVMDGAERAAPEGPSIGPINPGFIGPLQDTTILTSFLSPTLAAPNIDIVVTGFLSFDEITWLRAVVSSNMNTFCQQTINPPQHPQKAFETNLELDRLPKTSVP